MDFYEKPDLENIRKDRENQAWLHNRYKSRFLVGTIAMVLFGAHLFFSNHQSIKVPQPTQQDIESAATLTSLEGREDIISEKHDGAKIIAERVFDKDIISVFELDNMYSFAVFESLKSGYWMEYCGSLFPKTELVKATVFLGDNTHAYDIYLQYADTYESLSITRTHHVSPYNVQQENIRFDENGIAIMELESEITDPKPKIVAYDANGNHIVLADGTF